MADAREFYVGSMRALLNPNLTDGDQVVYDALCAHANQEGLCWPSIDTLCRLTRDRTDRAVRKSLRVLEAEGLIKTWKEGSFNRYQVLRDTPDQVIARTLGTPITERNGGSGVATEKQHRNGGSGEGGGEREFRTGTPVPVEGNVGSGGTGTGVPGEQEQEQETDLTAADAREEPSMTGPTRSDSTPDSGASLRQQCVDLALAVNRALRDNPATASQAQLYPLRADLAATPLSEWLAEGIPFDLIRDTCAALAGRFKPIQPGHKISRFTYFALAVREAWGKAQANAAVDRAGPTPIAPPTKKIRRLTA